MYIIHSTKGVTYLPHISQTIWVGEGGRSTELEAELRGHLVGGLRVPFVIVPLGHPLFLLPEGLGDLSAIDTCVAPRTVRWKIQHCELYVCAAGRIKVRSGCRGESRCLAAAGGVAAVLQKVLYWIKKSVGVWLDRWYRRAGWG